MPTGALLEMVFREPGEQAGALVEERALETCFFNAFGSSNKAAVDGSMPASISFASHRKLNFPDHRRLSIRRGKRRYIEEL